MLSVTYCRSAENDEAKDEAPIRGRRYDGSDLVTTLCLRLSLFSLSVILIQYSGKDQPAEADVDTLRVIK
jgi:hypothetical protein